MKVLLILGVLCFIFRSRYILKRINRKRLRKYIETDNSIKDCVNETSKCIQDNNQLREMQKKIQIVTIFKVFLEVYFWVTLLIVPPVYMLLYLYQNEKTLNNIYEELVRYPMIWFVLVVINIVIVWIMQILSNKKYIKFKEEFKKVLFQEFFSRFNYLIKWNEISFKFGLKQEYVQASFNQIDALSEYEYSSMDLYFEDYIKGIYKENFIIEMSDFREVVTMRKGPNIIEKEGIFCKVHTDKNIMNSIRITNNKFHLCEKHYMVTSMSERFYKNFKIVAQNGLGISEKINPEVIDIMQEFQDKNKIKFDISIINNDIFFRFETIDSMEPRRFGNILDNLMLEEYANIIMFVVKFCEGCV